MKDDSETEKMRKLITADMVDFAEKCARKIQPSYPLPLEDLKEAAYLGLCKAAKNYQPEKGATFKSLAFKHIRKQIEKQYQKLKGSSLHTISLDRLLEWMEGQEESEGNEGDCPEDLSPADLEDSLIEEDEAFLRFEADNLPEIPRLLQILSPRELVIIQSYFGLKEEPKSYQEIGEKLKLGKVRIRQICKKALVKMKESALNTRNAHEKH